MTITTFRKASPHALAAAGNAKALRRAHRHRVDVTAKDWFGRTPLHFAALIDHRTTRDCIGVLLRRGANLDARDKSGLTPVDWARESDNRGALQLFGLWRKTSTQRRAPLRAQAGFTLVEFLISLAGLATVAAGIYTLFLSGSDSAELVRAQVETTSLSSALMSAYVSRASFVGLTTQSAIAEGWVPDELKGTTGLPLNAWSQPINLSAIDLDVASDAKGALIEQGVPTEACIRFVASVADGFNVVRVNGHDVALEDAQNPSALAGPCADGGDLARVSLVRRRI